MLTLIFLTAGDTNLSNQYYNRYRGDMFTELFQKEISSENICLVTIHEHFLTI